MLTRVIYSLIIPFIFFSQITLSQNDCPKIYVDIINGTINNLKLTADMDQVKDSLPCFTGSSAEDEVINCGGGVFFLDDDFYFYTGQDYVQFRSKFKGEVSDSLLGLHPSEIEKSFGKSVRYEEHGNRVFIFFKTSYGCLQIRLQNDIVVSFSMHAMKARKVDLCL